MFVKKNMKTIYHLLLLFATIALTAQTEIHWDGQYQLQQTDFKSPATEIGSGNLYSVSMPIGVEFNIAMSNAQFMFTKNFNCKVSTIFRAESSSMVAPNTSYVPALVAFANYQFDLAELYARKFRKKLYEEKGTFSNVSFIRPIYDQVQRDFMNQITISAKETDMGRKEEEMAQLHQAVKEEIATLADYCKECKISKKKKK